MTRFKDKYRIETTRLPGWNYASAGWYFVTICTRDQQPFFGHIENGDMYLSPIGEIAAQFWQEIPRHTVGHVSLDVFVVMPNHVHGIVVIQDTPVETLHCNVSTDNVDKNLMSTISPQAGSLGAIIRSYKSAVTRWCRQNGYAEFGWQSRFYDHVIRNENALHNIRQYISENPSRWEMDQNHPDNLWV
ncbi:MAG: transposase [Phototrophicales bacterium]|nr:MAG: transposase [Phototrophicales bacterium]